MYHPHLLHDNIHALHVLLFHSHNTVDSYKTNMCQTRYSRKAKFSGQFFFAVTSVEKSINLPYPIPDTLFFFWDPKLKTNNFFGPFVYNLFNLFNFFFLFKSQSFLCYNFACNQKYSEVFRIIQFYGNALHRSFKICDFSPWERILNLEIQKDIGPMMMVMRWEVMIGSSRPR